MADRGVIYQNQVGVWEYLAGTMWGTRIPPINAQPNRPRPAADAGFDASHDGIAAAWKFVWSQTAWVPETTAPVRYDTHAN